jgi:hypothetical protein
MKKHLFVLAISALLLSTQSCKKEDTKKTYDIPTTYNFDSVDYSGQKIRLQMMTELVTQIRNAAVNAAVTVDSAKVKAMYVNTGNYFSHDSLNNSGKQLKDKTFSTEQVKVDDWIDAAATVSATNTTGQNGTAGRVANGSSFVMLDADGFEFKEAIEKTFQGALVYYQITAVYLGTDKVGPQVALSARKHHWDEAFGYIGLNKDYTINKSKALTQQLGRYAFDRDSLLGNATKAVEAFIKGRAAINNEDNETVTEQIAIVREQVERGVAGTAVHYINGALANISGNQGSFMHQLNEGYFLVKALKYNPAKKVSESQYNELMGYFGDNLYEVSETNLKKAKDLLSTIYGFDSVKDVL